MKKVLLVLISSTFLTGISATLRAETMAGSTNSNRSIDYDYYGAPDPLRNLVIPKREGRLKSKTERPALDYGYYGEPTSSRNLVLPKVRVDNRPCPYNRKVKRQTPQCSILHSQYLANHGGWQHANPVCTPGIDVECTDK